MTGFKKSSWAGGSKILSFFSSGKGLPGPSLDPFFLFFDDKDTFTGQEVSRHPTTKRPRVTETEVSQAPSPHGSPLPPLVVKGADTQFPHVSDSVNLPSPRKIERLLGSSPKFLDVKMVK